LHKVDKGIIVWGHYSKHVCLLCLRTRAFRGLKWVHGLGL